MAKFKYLSSCQVRNQTLKCPAPKPALPSPPWMELPQPTQGDGNCQVSLSLQAKLMAFSGSACPGILGLIYLLQHRYRHYILLYVYLFLVLYSNVYILKLKMVSRRWINSIKFTINGGGTKKFTINKAFLPPLLFPNLSNFIRLPDLWDSLQCFHRMGIDWLLTASWFLLFILELQRFFKMQNRFLVGLRHSIRKDREGMAPLGGRKFSVYFESRGGNT